VWTWIQTTGTEMFAAAAVQSLKVCVKTRSDRMWLVWTGDLWLEGFQIIISLLQYQVWSSF